MTDALDRAAKVLPDMRGLLTAEDRREYAYDIILAFLEWEGMEDRIARVMCAAHGYDPDQASSLLHADQNAVTVAPEPARPNWTFFQVAARAALAAIQKECA